LGGPAVPFVKKRPHALKPARGRGRQAVHNGNQRCQVALLACRLGQHNQTRGDLGAIRQRIGQENGARHPAAQPLQVGTESDRLKTEADKRNKTGKVSRLDGASYGDA